MVFYRWGDVRITNPDVPRQHVDWGQRLSKIVRVPANCGSEHTFVRLTIHVYMFCKQCKPAIKLLEIVRQPTSPCRLQHYTTWLWGYYYMLEGHYIRRWWIVNGVPSWPCYWRTLVLTIIDWILTFLPSDLASYIFRLDINRISFTPAEKYYLFYHCAPIHFPIFLLHGSSF